MTTCQGEKNLRCSLYARASIYSVVSALGPVSTVWFLRRGQYLQCGFYAGAGIYSVVSTLGPVFTVCYYVRTRIYSELFLRGQDLWCGDNEFVFFTSSTRNSASPPSQEASFYEPFFFNHQVTLMEGCST